MSLRAYEENDVRNIANAIRGKTGTADTYTVSAMAPAINNIQGGGNYDTLNVSSNGEYTPSGDVDAWNVVNVQVPSSVPDDVYYANTTNIYIGSNVDNLAYAFYQRRDIESEPVMSNNIINATSAYEWCVKITGNAAFGENVNSCSRTYYRCVALTGIDDSIHNSKNLSELSDCFSYCLNLQVAKFPPNVIGMNRTFQGCSNLVSLESIPNTCHSLGQAFDGCNNLGGDWFNFPLATYIANQWGNNTHFNNIMLPPNYQQSYQYITEQIWNCNVYFPYVDPVRAQGNQAFARNTPWLINAYRIFGIAPGLNAKGTLNVFTIRNSFFDLGLRAANNFIGRGNGSNYQFFENGNGYFYESQNVYVYYLDDNDAIPVMNVLWGNAANRYNNSGLSGVPYCGDYVTNMRETYNMCINLTGSPVCGNNVKDMTYAYRGCSNLTGSPVFGPNVNQCMGAYQGCSNLTGSPVWPETLTTSAYISDLYKECSNLTGNAVFGRDAKNLSNSLVVTYYNCSNLTGIEIPNNANNMDYFANGCSWYTGTTPNIPDTVTTMSCAFFACSGMIGSPKVGNSVVDMRYAYQYCSNLTGSPVVPNNSIVGGGFVSTYDGCRNLTGAPVFPVGIESANYSYQNCSNLSGDCVVPNKVRHMAYTFAYCSNLNITIGSRDVSFTQYCFRNASNINVFLYRDSSTNGAFNSTSPTGVEWTRDAENNRYYNPDMNIYVYYNLGE